MRNLFSRIKISPILIMGMVITGLFAYYLYQNLLIRIENYEQEMRLLQAKNNDLTLELKESKRMVMVYKNDWIDESTLEHGVNLKSELTGFLSPVINEEIPARSRDLIYLGKTTQHVTCNLLELPSAKDYLIGYQEYIYESEPFFISFSADRMISSYQAARAIPVDMKKEKFLFTSRYGFKVYQDTWNDGYMFLFTPKSDGKTRLVKIGFNSVRDQGLDQKTSDQLRVVAKREIIEIINSMRPSSGDE